MNFSGWKIREKKEMENMNNAQLKITFSNLKSFNAFWKVKTQTLFVKIPNLILPNEKLK